MLIHSSTRNSAIAGSRRPIGVSLILLLIVVLFSSAANAQPADPASIGQIEIAAWDSLDRARELHLAGEGELALRVLGNIAADSTITDRQLHNARRELTAFVLYSEGEFQSAFDTLRVFSERSIERAREENEFRVKEADRRIDSLKTAIEEQHQQIARIERDHREKQEEHQIIFIGTIAILLVALSLLAFRSKRDPSPGKTIAPSIPEAVVVREKEKTRPSSPEPSQTRSGSNLMHSHLSMIADRLNKGETVEAAAHVGMLSRYVKMQDDIPSDDLQPAHQAIAFLRQYLKLAALRSGKKLRYELEADRSVLDRNMMLPVRRAAQLLATLDRALHQDGSFISIRAVQQENADRAMLLIEFPIDPDNAGNSFNVAGLVIDRSTRNGKGSLSVKW